MKNKIINYFNNDRSYRSGIALINEFSMKINLKKQLCVQPESKFMTGVMYEELRELAGLTNDMLSMMLCRPVPKSFVIPMDNRQENDPALKRVIVMKPVTENFDGVNEISATETELNSIPTFDFLKRLEQFHEMNNGSLLKLHDQLLWNIKYQKRMLKKYPLDTRACTRKRKMQEYQKELTEVIKILNAR